MSAIQRLLDKIEEVYEFGDDVKEYPGKWTQALIATMDEWRAAKAEYAALVALLRESEWAGSDEGTTICWKCQGHYIGDSHEKDCAFAAALDRGGA